MDGRDGFAPEPGIVAGIFLLPELPNERVFDSVYDRAPVVFIGQQTIDPKQCRVLAFQERCNGVLQNVFHSRPPRVGPETLERLADSRNDQRAFVSGNVGEQVESDWETFRIVPKLSAIFRSIRKGSDLPNALERFCRLSNSCGSFPNLAEMIDCE